MCQEGATSSGDNKLNNEEPIPDVERRTRDLIGCSDKKKHLVAGDKQIIIVKHAPTIRIAYWIVIWNELDFAKLCTIKYRIFVLVHTTFQKSFVKIIKAVVLQCIHASCMCFSTKLICNIQQ